MNDNYLHVAKGFMLLTEVLSPFICQQCERKFGEAWWKEGILDKLYAGNY